jgi:hypothetical protein
MGAERGSTVTLATVLVTAALAFALAGCGDRAEREPEERPAGETSALSSDGEATARVTVPDGEARSIGTFVAAVTLPDGSTRIVEGERDGSVAGTWLCDLTGDGELELVVVTTSAGSGSYGAVSVFRQQAGGFVPVPVADLSASQTEGYMGHDEFAIREGRLVRSFPRYLEGDPNANPTGGTVRLAYSFASEEWIEEER